MTRLKTDREPLVEVSSKPGQGQPGKPACEVVYFFIEMVSCSALARQRKYSAQAS